MNTIINKEDIIYEEDLIAEDESWIRKDLHQFSVQQIYNIPNRGHDKGPIAREVQSNKRKEGDGYDDDKNDKENNNNLNFNEL
ncbi:unnamed protein product [Rhizophagus irregularis]|nr:unnamed protein product [Rhizophagus irregularis]CAB4439457.1 unnamed protein product [Rhizophagus irregularis]